MPYKTRSGRTPQKESSSTDTLLRKRKLRKIFFPGEIKEEEEEEDGVVWCFLGEKKGECSCRT